MSVDLVPEVLVVVVKSQDGPDVEVGGMEEVVEGG